MGLVVDASDAEIEALLQAVPLDVLQLHGYETPERVAEIALRFGCRVIKALRAETPDDLAALPAYAEAADMILFDAKPPRDAAFPGGHGLPFDWRLLEGVALRAPLAARRRAACRKRGSGRRTDQGADRRCVVRCREPAGRQGPGQARSILRGRAPRR